MTTLTGISEEDVFSDFLSSLYELAGGSKDVFNDIEKSWQEMINKMVVNDFIFNEEFQEKLKAWRKKVADLNREKIEKGMSPQTYKARLEELNKEYQGYMNEAREDLQVYKDAGIVADTDSHSQQATMNSINNISYDQADSLIGILTSHTIVQERISQGVDMLNVKFDQALIPITETRDIAADSRDILAGMAIHVEEIRDGVVDTLVPRIKNMDTEITRMRKAVEER